MLKKAIKFVIKSIIGIAALVFLVTNPFRSREHAVAFFISILVMIVCGGFAAWLQDDDDPPKDNRPIN